MEHVKIKGKLLQSIKEKKIPNSICFVDKGGRGGLHLACELGLFIVENKAKLSTNSGYVHPDLHFLYPTKIPKKESTFKKKMNTFYLNTWRKFISSSIYGSFEEWLNFSSSIDRPGTIRVGQIEETISVLNLKPFKSDRKVCVIWGLDYLKSDAGNRLLKVIEEPPKNTSFFLVAKDEKKIMKTIRSRSQIIMLPSLNNDTINGTLLETQFGESSPLKGSKKSSNVSFNWDLKNVNIEQDKKREALFIECLRSCYKAVKRGDFTEVVENSFELGSLSKTDLKEFFLFGIHFIRQSFLYSQGVTKLYKYSSLNGFSIEKFAPYVSKENYGRLISLFEKNLYYMDRNANHKILTFSFLLKFSSILYLKN